MEDDGVISELTSLDCSRSEFIVPDESGRMTDSFVRCFDKDRILWGFARENSVNVGGISISTVVRAKIFDKEKFDSSVLKLRSRYGANEGGLSFDWYVGASFG
jgi:hypothetical protein